MKIGITGHQRLQGQSNWSDVKAMMVEHLARVGQPLVGVTSLAIGADQIFADAILEQGGALHVVIPFEGYELKFDEGVSRQTYNKLIDRAAEVEVLQRAGSDEESYFAAGKRVVDLSDQLIAVWNGKPAEGLGGTADVVDYARSKDLKILIIQT